MKKQLKRTLSAFAVAMLLAALLCPYGLAAVVEKSESFYVADYAGVLSEATKKRIIDYNGSLEQQCDGAQVVVVTINYLSDGLDSQQYATKLFNDWGVGSSSANNGMLLLLVAKEHKGWLLQGYGISGSFTNEDADNLLNKHFWKFVDAGQYDEGVNAVFTQILKWYDSYYGSSILPPDTSKNEAGGYYGDSYPDNNNYYYYESSAGGFISSALSLIFGIAIFLIIISLFSRRRRYYRGSAFPFFMPFFFGSWFRRPPGPGPRPPYHNRWNDRWNGRGGGRGGGGFGGFGGGGFGGGSGFGGGGFSGGGGGGRR